MLVEGAAAIEADPRRPWTTLETILLATTEVHRELRPATDPTTSEPQRKAEPLGVWGRWLTSETVFLNLHHHNSARPLTPTHSARSLSPTPSIQSGSNTPASANGFPPSSSGKAVYTRYRDRERDRDRDRDHYTYHHHPYDPPHASGSSYRRYERPPPPLPLPPSSSSRHPYPPPSRADYRESHHRHSSYGGPASAGLPPVGGGRAATAEAPPPPPLSARIHQAGTLPSATSTVSSTSTSSAVGSTSSSSIGSYARPALLPPQASGGLEYGDAEEDEEEEKRPAPEPAVEVKPGSAAVKSEPGGPAARERPESNPSQCQNQADDTPVSESENQQLPLPDGKLASAPDEHGERTEASPSLAPEQPTEPAAASDQAKSETSAVQEDQMQKAEQTKSSDAASSTAVDAATTPASLPQKSATDVGDMDLDSASLQRHSPQNLPEPASSAAQPKPDQTAAAPQEESTHHAEENQIPNLAPSAVANITNQTVIKDKSQEDTLRPQESPTRDTDMELDSATLQSRFEQNATEPARIESFQAIPPTEPQPDLTEGPSEPATLPIAHPGAEESPAQQQEDVLIASLDAGVAVSSETDVAAATAEPKPGDAQDENEKTAQGPTQTKENAEQPTAVAVAMDVDQVDAPEKVTAPAPINLPTQEEPMQHLSASLEQQPHEMASPETKLEADQTSISMAPDVEMQGPSKAAPASAVAAEEPKKAEEAKTASPPPKNFDELLHRSAQTSIAREEAFIEAFMRTVPSQPPQASSARLPSGRPRLSELTNGSTPHATAYYLPDVYQYNHNILRSRLEADFNQANQYRQSKIHALQERYLELHWTWKVLCERRERDKYQHDNRPLPAGSTYTLEQLGWAPHAAGGNNFQFGAGGPTSQLMSNMPPQSPGQPTTPLASGSHAHMSGAPSGRSSRRSGGGGAAFGHPFGDAVRSEAEFHEILKTLEDVDFLDPKSRAAKSAAVVPDMLLLDDPRRAVAAFEDDNARVEHPEAFYGIGQANVSRSDPAATEWTDEEVQTFLRRFAQFPKQFGKIAQELPDKNVSQCVLFYYRSKRTIDFRSLVERKYAGGRRGKRSRLLENSSGSSSLFTEVQERSKGKGKKTAPPMLGAEELGLSPPSTPQVGPPNHPTTYINKQMLNEPLTKSGLGAQVTHSILHGTSRRTEVEAARAKRRLTAAEAKQNQQQQQQQQEETSAAAAAAAAAATSTATAATPGGGPPSESQLEAAEALASLFAKPAPQANGDVDMADTTPTTTTTANSLQSSQQGAPPRTKRKLNPTSYWSTAEKSDFVKWLGVYGKDFPSIAQHIQNKSATQCRNVRTLPFHCLSPTSMSDSSRRGYTHSIGPITTSSSISTPSLRKPLDKQTRLRSGQRRRSRKRLRSR